jgi:large subunit ribosomal protein L6
MSRVGNKPVTIPEGVNVAQQDGSVTVKGPKGELSEVVVAHVTVVVEGAEVLVARADDSKPSRANHGLMRSLIQNMVKGVTEGFNKELHIIGVGYRAQMRGSKLVMQLGYSHPIEYDLPAGINVVINQNTELTVSGNSKQLVGQVAAKIRSYREPDHYKGKGIRYKGEYVRIKQGKA